MNRWDRFMVRASVILGIVVLVLFAVASVMLLAGAA
jgi:hypothetical protein